MTFNLRSRTSVIVLGLITSLGFAIAQPAAARADTVVRTQTISGYADANKTPETDKLTLSYSGTLNGTSYSVQTLVNQGALSAADAKTSTCHEVTATDKYSAPAGTLWTATADKVFCYNGTKITYDGWLVPSENVTNLGTATGWQYVGYTQGKSVVNSCLHTGNQTFTFKQSFPVVGQIKKIVDPINIRITCKGAVTWS